MIYRSTFFSTDTVTFLGTIEMLNLQSKISLLSMRLYDISKKTNYYCYDNYLKKLLLGMQQKVQHKEKKLWKKRTKVILDYVFVVKVPYSYFDHIFEISF